MSEGCDRLNAANWSTRLPVSCNVYVRDEAHSAIGVVYLYSIYLDIDYTNWFCVQVSLFSSFDC